MASKTDEFPLFPQRARVAPPSRLVSAQALESFMVTKLENMEKSYEELQAEMGKPEVRYSGTLLPAPVPQPADAPPPGRGLSPRRTPASLPTEPRRWRRTRTRS